MKFLHAIGAYSTGHVNVIHEMMQQPTERKKRNSSKFANKRKHSFCYVIWMIESSLEKELKTCYMSWIQAAVERLE